MFWLFGDRHARKAAEQMRKMESDQGDRFSRYARAIRPHVDAACGWLESKVRILEEELAAERALADHLADGVRDLYEHSHYLDRYNKAREKK